LLISWRSRSFPKSLACVDTFVKIMVRDLLDKSACLLLAPKSDAQTASMPRLEGFAVRAVTSLTSMIVSKAVRFATSQNALIASKFSIALRVTSISVTIAKIPSSVEDAARNFAMSAVPIGYLAVDATSHFCLGCKDMFVCDGCNEPFCNDCTDMLVCCHCSSKAFCNDCKDESISTCVDCGHSICLDGESMD
jgi:hypothetical protein